MSNRRPPHLKDEDLLWLGSDDLEPGAAKRIREHLKQCAACQATRTELADFEALLGSVKFEEPSPEKWEPVRQAVLEDFRRQQPWRLPGPAVAVLESIRRMWMLALEDPLVAVSYVAMAMAYVSYSLLSSSTLEPLLPEMGQLVGFFQLAL
jgi:hypothetical protein